MRCGPNAFICRRFATDAFTAESPSTTYQSVVGYDLAGDITSIQYPDGRVVSQDWNDLKRLTHVYSGPTDYLVSAAYNNDGSPATLDYGNGDTVSTGENIMQQVDSIWLERTASNGVPAQLYMALGYCYNGEDYEGAGSCGGDIGNGGNVSSITNLIGDGSQDKLYAYDHLNRLVSYHKRNDPVESYAIDPWGNMNRTNVGQGPLNFPTSNRRPDLTCSGPGGSAAYDGAGNQTCDGDPAYSTVHRYLFNPENQITAVTDGGDTALASYTLSADGARVRKDLANGSWKEYFDVGGQVLAEKDQTGSWTDYIYANGRKLAKVDSQKPILHMHGVRDGSIYMGCGVEGPVIGVPNGLAGYTIRQGDHIMMDVMQTLPTYGGLALIFQDGTGSGTLHDISTGTPFYFNGVADGSWHTMVGDLSEYAGETISYVLAGIHNNTPAGTFDVYMHNAVVQTTDGRTLPILTGQSASVGNFTGTQCGGYNLSSTTEATPTSDPKVSTNYYVADHLGTTQMELSSGGWPVWKGDFDPWGQERDAQLTSNNYKFTGKERDAESGDGSGNNGLDMFGERYYSNSTGRFLSVDPLLSSGKPADPQSWNRYSYTANSPMRFTDPTGLYTFGKCNASPSDCEAYEQRFRNSIAGLEKSLGTYKAGSPEYGKIADALKKLGKEGEGPVKVNFGDAGHDANGRDYLGKTVGTNMILNYAAQDATFKNWGVKPGGEEAANYDSGLSGHEGTHIGKGFLIGLMRMKGENAAYYTEGLVYEGLHQTDRIYGLWFESWRTLDKDLLEKTRNQAVYNFQHGLQPPVPVQKGVSPF